MFTRAADILRIWSGNGIGDLGLFIKKSVVSVPSKIVYFLRNTPITLSTWMCTFAIPLVLSTLIGSGWALPSVNAGYTNSALLEETLSWIVKPLSAMTISPATSLSINTQFLVKNLSDVLPPQVFDRNDMVTW